MEIQGRMEGLSDTMAVLNELQKPSNQRQAMRKALQPATKPILDEVRARVPRRSGLTRKSIGRKTKTYSRTGTVLVLVGPRSKPSFRRQVTVRGRDGKPRTIMHDPVKTAHLVEFGTQPHQVGGVQHPGAEPKPFMRPGFDAKQAEAKAIFGRELFAEVKAIIAKRRAKGKVA